MRKLGFSNVILFTGARYVIYFLQIVRGFAVAKLLGPYYFGVYGFILLVLQYLSYTNFGIQYSLNLTLSTNINTNDEIIERTFSSALYVSLSVSAILLLGSALVSALGITIFEKYLFNRYLLPVVGIACFYHFQQLFSSVNRVMGKLPIIACVELIGIVIPFITIFFFRSIELVDALVYSTLIAAAIGFCLFWFTYPYRKFIQIEIREIKELLIVGIQLLIYNLSFFLFVAVGRTLIGFFYNVEIMGLYSFATSITTILFLGFDSIVWAFYSNILWNFREDVTSERASKLIIKITGLYATTVFFVIFIVILSLPAVFRILKAYESIESVLIILLLAQGVIASGFGCNSFATARRKLLYIALISIVGLIVVITFGFIAIYFSMDFIWIAVATLMGSIIFLVVQALFVRRLLGKNNVELKIFKDIFPFRTIIPIAIVLCGLFSSYSYVINILGFITFIIFHRTEMIANSKMLLGYVKTKQ